MQTKRFLITVIVVAILAAGCDDAPDANPISADLRHEPSEAVQFIPIAWPEAAQAIRRKPRAERSAFENGFIDSVAWAGGAMNNLARHLIAEAQKKNRGWQGADAQVRRALLSFKQETAFTAEQFAALAMLDRVLLGGEVTLEKQAAIAFYAQLLLKNGSPAADVLLRAAEALQGYWSDEAIAQAVALTAQHAEAWLGAQAEAVSKASSVLLEQPNQEELLDARARRLLAVRDAVKAMKAFSP